VVGSRSYALAGRATQVKELREKEVE